ncbi:MAG: TatD family hydrolase [bacterium]|nr:TatD family hydrolase [bacterium]
MFDTHCHLNFSRFKKNFPEVIQRAKEAGIDQIVVPGTDVESSKKAVEIAERYEGVWAAVGVHPHHVYELNVERGTSQPKADEILAKNVKIILYEIEKLLSHPKVVAVGEVGVDRHTYEETKYETYNVEESFIDLQKELLREQIKLAVKYKKSLILHNREAKIDLLEELNEVWDSNLEGRTVFHCCESDTVGTGRDLSLLDYAIEKKIYIGVDGDITYDLPESIKKKEFIKKVPLEMLVLETDSPFLLPEPLRTKKEYPNEPKNLTFIATYVAELKGMSVEELAKQTTKNAKRLFNISSSSW